MQRQPDGMVEHLLPHRYLYTLGDTHRLPPVYEQQWISSDIVAINTIPTATTVSN